MRVRTVINAIHCLLTAALAVFAWLSYQPDPRTGDTLQSVRQINPETWLYTTQNNDGNATVPTIYRYYLRSVGNADVKQLRDNVPFLTGSGTISAISVDSDTVNVSYSGKVYGIEQHTGGYFLTYSLK